MASTLASINQDTSTKDIPARERLIFAMDVSTVDEAKSLATTLGDSVMFYKLGLQLFMAGGYFELIEWLHELNKKVFVDLKFFDVPETVKSAVAQLKNKHVEFVSVHGNDNILQAAVSEKNGTKVLAVTVLTSLDDNDIRDLGFQVDVLTLVRSRAKRALEIGCAGIISSGIEAPSLRQEFGSKFLIVTPGIRPVLNMQEKPDDQKRVTDARTAIRNGADYVVVGRPIRDAADPRKRAEEIQAEIAAALESRERGD